MYLFYYSISLFLFCFIRCLLFSICKNAIYALFSASHSSTFSLTAATNPLALG